MNIFCMGYFIVLTHLFSADVFWPLIILFNILQIYSGAGIRYYGIYSVNCIRISWQKHNGFRFPPIFWWNYSVESVFTQCITCQCWKNKSKVDFVLNTHIKPLIKFMNKVLIIVQKLHVWCDAFKVIWFGINRN